MDSCYDSRMFVKLVRTFMWVPALTLGLLACSEDDARVPPDQVFGGSTGGGTSTSPTMCGEYCQTLVDNAPGCEKYNANGRCVDICNWYRDTACQTTYEAFVTCLTSTQGAECMLPEGGRITLVVASCHSEYNAWVTCRDEKDAGICPY